ncbi:MAG: trypsin-like peptidase domain-containing protein [Firmicutes bacterium]|nr:trypsin-like peptidase domain-containing protein [Bacillota bacterium]
MKRTGPWTHFLIGVLGVLFGALIVFHLTNHSPRPMDWPVAQVAKKVGPSVVVVFNNQKVGTHLKTRGLGSGVIISGRGEIVTNYHVVAGAKQVVVALSNGRRYIAHIQGVDPATDLALIKIRANHLQAIQFASSSQIEPGQLVVAIGNSLGLSHTVTAGIISSKDREVYRDGWAYHLIQTDAPINPGNSGGALVNTQGQLIGINSSKISQTGVEGIGFAIPSNTVEKVVAELQKYGHVRRPWIGVQMQYAGSKAPGVFIVAVDAGSPAAHAGIRPGDFITQINGKPVKRVIEVNHLLSQIPIGQKVSIKVLQQTLCKTVQVKVAEAPLTALPNSKHIG